MLERVFRCCQLLAAGCLVVAAGFQIVGYVTASIAVANSGLEPYLQRSFRALWLGSALQSLLLAAIFLLAGLRPRWISRPVVVLCGLLPIASSTLFFAFVGSGWGQALSGLSALAVLGAALIWPKPEAEPLASGPAGPGRGEGP